MMVGVVGVAAQHVEGDLVTPPRMVQRDTRVGCRVVGLDVGAQ